MKIIDTKGRLFGAINLIDLMIIIVVLSLCLSIIFNFMTKSGEQNKADAEILIKALYNIPDELVASNKILQTGDRVLAGRAIVEKVLQVRRVVGSDNRSAGHSEILVLLRAKCVMLNGEYYCANMPIKINAPFTFSNPLYILQGGTIIDIEKVSGPVDGKK